MDAGGVKFFESLCPREFAKTVHGHELGIFLLYFLKWALK